MGGCLWPLLLHKAGRICAYAKHLVRSQETCLSAERIRSWPKLALDGKVVFSVSHLAQNPGNQNFCTPEKLLPNSGTEQNVQLGWFQREDTQTPFYFWFLKGSRCQMPSFNSRESVFNTKAQSSPNTLSAETQTPSLFREMHTAAAGVCLYNQGMKVVILVAAGSHTCKYAVAWSWRIWSWRL